MEKNFAGFGAFLSSALASLSWVEQIDTLIRWGAGLAAIWCAIYTGMYYRNKRNREK